MALPSVPHTFRLQVNLVEDGVYEDRSVTAAQHPSETLEHLLLRALGFSLFFRAGIEFGPGLADGDGADVWAHDDTGRVSLWVECGASDPQKTDRVLNQHAGARVALVTCKPARERDFLEAAARRSRRLKDLEVVHVPGEILDALVRQERRRWQWNVTVSDRHLYLVADGEALDAPLLWRSAADALAAPAL